jgi:hypothetical protein
MDGKLKMKTLDNSIVSAIQNVLEEALANSIVNPLSQEEFSKIVMGLKFTDSDASITPEAAQAILQVRLPDATTRIRET